MAKRQMFMAPEVRKIKIRGVDLAVRALSSSEDQRARAEMLTRPTPPLVQNPAKGSLSGEVVLAEWDAKYQRELSEYQRRLYVLIAAIATDWEIDGAPFERTQTGADAAIKDISETLSDGEIAAIVNASREASAASVDEARKN